MIKRHEMSLERLNKVGHNFAEYVMSPEEEAKGFNPIAGQGFMNKGVPKGIMPTGNNNPGGWGGSNGGFPLPPNPPPVPPPYGGQGGWNGGGGYGGGYGSPNQFNPDTYLPIYQPNNFGVNPNIPINTDFQGMYMPKNAAKMQP